MNANKHQLKLKKINKKEFKKLKLNKSKESKLHGYEMLYLLNAKRQNETVHK